MARKKLTQKLTGFPLFHKQTNGFTFPLTHSFTKDFVGLDGLSLDLQFATDKTLTARKGPTPTFTRASTATFVGSDGLIQSAAINAARFDHDPVTLASRGLLIEESRTNLLQRSEELDNAYWSKVATTVAGSQTSPSGNSSADVITASVGAGRHIVFREFTGTAVPYTFSLFLKKGTNSFAQLQLTQSGASNNFAIIVDLDTGLVTDTRSVGATSPSSSVIALSNGWYRVSITLTLSAAQWFVLVALSNASVPSYDANNNPSFIALGTETIFAWGAQLEAGSFPTSYIPTTTASVVRSADVCSITGSDFTGFYNQSEGTLFANIQSTGSGDRRPVAFDIGNNSQFYNFYATSALSRYAQASGSLGSFTMAGTVPSTPLLYAGTLKHGDYSLALNGSIVGSSAVSLGATFTTLRIGAGGGGGGQFLCGHLASIRYYKKRLSNAKLVTITV